MAGASRYSISDEEAGLNQGILKNKLGYTIQKDIDDAETILQVDAYKHFFSLAQARKVSFGIDLLFEIHRYFFETLYTWAGKIRTVEISKDGVLFAPVKYISSSLRELDYIIQKNIPTSSDTILTISKKLATIHNEFNAIHPFRDGNGRTIRLLIDLLAQNAEFKPIHFGNKKKYLDACRQGMSKTNVPMEKILQLGLKKSK